MSKTCSPSWNRSRTVTPGALSPRAWLGQGEGHGAPQDGREGGAPGGGAGTPGGAAGPTRVAAPAEAGGAHPARADGEAHDEAGGHAEIARHIGLAENHRGGEGRHEHEAEGAEENERPDAAHEKKGHGERRSEKEHAHHEAPVPDAVRDGARDEGARGARGAED